eukprot:m.24540 g.24540  ORF g.24540 m.24540 type:complete len:176 (+) comp11524_c0_seq1:18-545(+)
MDNSVYGPIAKRFLTACRKGRLVEIEELLTTSSDPVRQRLLGQKDLDGYTGLHKAAYNGHTITVAFLLDSGCDILAPTKDGWRPLHCAARWNKAETAELLLARGADINLASDAGLTALHVAASRIDTLDVLRVLLQHGEGYIHSLQTKQGDTLKDMLEKGPYADLLQEDFAIWKA